MKDLSNFEIYPKNVDSEYFKIVIKQNHSHITSSIYETDGQISYLLKIRQREYMDALQGRFKFKFEKNNTLISKEEDFEEVKSLLESFLLLNKIR